MVEQGLQINLSQESTTKPQGPGATLRLQREASGVSLSHIAKQLKLSIPRLTQIEHDDYTGFAAIAFARGHLSSYARLLSMSEVEIKKIMSLFDELNLGATISSNKPTLLNEKITTSSSGVIRIIGYIVLAALLGLVTYWWRSHTHVQSTKIAASVAMSQASMQESASTQNPSESSVQTPEAEPAPPPTDASSMQNTQATTPPETSAGGESASNYPSSSPSAMNQVEPTDQRLPVLED